MMLRLSLLLSLFLLLLRLVLVGTTDDKHR